MRNVTGTAKIQTAKIKYFLCDMQPFQSRSIHGQPFYYPGYRGDRPFMWIKLNIEIDKLLNYEHNMVDAPFAAKLVRVYSIVVGYRLCKH